MFKTKIFFLSVTFLILLIPALGQILPPLPLKSGTSPDSSTEASEAYKDFG